MRLLVALVGALEFSLPLAGVRAIPATLTPVVDPRPDHTVCCGWGYTEEGLRGQVVPINGAGARSNLNPTLWSAVIAWGCHCEWFGDKGCNRERGFYLSTNMFMVDFGAPVQCFSCMFNGHAKNGTNANEDKNLTEMLAFSLPVHKVISADLAVETAYVEQGAQPSKTEKRGVAEGEPETLPNTNTVYCGWAYSENGGRGYQLPLVLGSGARSPPDLAVKGAEVSAGCDCTFASDMGCDPNIGYSKRVRAFHGDFDQPIHCFWCDRGHVLKNGNT